MRPDQGVPPGAPQERLAEVLASIVQVIFVQEDPPGKGPRRGCWAMLEVCVLAIGRVLPTGGAHVFRWWRCCVVLAIGRVLPTGLTGLHSFLRITRAIIPASISWRPNATSSGDGSAIFPRSNAWLCILHVLILHSECCCKRSMGQGMLPFYWFPMLRCFSVLANA